MVANGVDPKNGRNVPGPVSSLAEALGKAGATVGFDAPAAADGEWWIDVRSGDRTTQVSWQGDRGFGVFLGDDGAYGAKPDELHGDPPRAAERLLQVLETETPETTRAPGGI